MPILRRVFTFFRANSGSFVLVKKKKLWRKRGKKQVMVHSFNCCWWEVQKTSPLARCVQTRMAHKKEKTDIHTTKVTSNNYYTWCQLDKIYTRFSVVWCLQSLSSNDRSILIYWQSACMELVQTIELDLIRVSWWANATHKITLLKQTWCNAMKRWKEQTSNPSHVLHIFTLIRKQ